ncbi:hypothetical protein ACEPAH_1223 [Sanghuangporus vaninii]
MATRPYEWQRLASPAPTISSHSGYNSGSGSHHSMGSQRAYMDPFHGVYPSAPHLRPIELPETGSPMVGFASPGSGSSRSRHTSLPPEGMGLGISINAYGLPSPPISPQSSRSGSGQGSAPALHPLLRGSSSLSASIIFNALYAPSAHGPYALRGSQGARISDSDLAFPATNPPWPRLRVSVLLYPGGAASINAPQRFFWDIELKQPRRTSAPPSSGLTLGDVLLSIHQALITPVDESEVRQLPAAGVHNARAMYASRRAAFPASPAGFVRADFTYGCTQFAGMVQNADNTFSVRLIAPPAAL